MTDSIGPRRSRATSKAKPAKPARPAKPGRLAAFSLAEQLARLEQSFDPTRERPWPERGLTAPEFPLLCERLDGFRNVLYVLAGASRMGKTAFALELLVDLLRAEPDARGLFVSLEQPARDLNVRLVAQAGEVNMEYLLNPTKEKAEKYDARKGTGLAASLALRDRLTIVDESCGALRVEDLRQFVEEVRRGFDGPLLMVVDPVFKVRCSAPASDWGAVAAELTREFKTLCLEHRVGIIATTGLGGAAGARRPELADLEGQSALLYDAHVVGLLYCDFVNNPETPFLEWEWGTDDLMVPVFELQVAKNKMGAFAGRIYYRFYNSYSKFKECVTLENEHYERMLHNLRVHDEADPAVDDQIVGRFEDLDRQK